MSEANDRIRRHRKARAGIVTNLDAAEEQVIFWRQHLDLAIEDMFPPIKLTRDQKVMARAIGNCIDIKCTCSRGFGKTWLASLCAFAIGVLYPGSNVLVVSATAMQATLALGKLKQLAEQNPNIANEINAANSRSLVQVSKDSSKCTLKNGSVIESVSLQSARGRRAKVVIVDEALDVNQDELESIVAPTRNATRSICFDYGFEDYPSKTITITSACAKTNQYYTSFMQTLKKMAKGDISCFACALDYRAAAANGITSLDFFMREKERMSEITFQTEYGSKFLGAGSNSAFPYELTQTCRTLTKIELEQPRNSKSRYVIALDIATSEAKNADNSVITVVKFVERSDGTFAKKLVYITSMHGETLDVLAEKIRILYHRLFPNTERIVYDARGLGDSFDRFFDREWIDLFTGKEYPPLVVDDEPLANSAALQVLHPIRAVQTLNQRMYSNMRVALEKKSLELPIQSRTIQMGDLANGTTRTEQEMAVFVDSDALQFEMGNIVGKIGASGKVLYDVPHQGQHKDRYSSLAMNIDYIAELEKENVKKYRRGTECIGVVSYF